MKPKNLYSKYYCDNKLKIYTDAPLNNYQYQKMIENAKPRYMNDYYNTPKFNRRKDEKSFNNLLNSYYSDYKKLKNKYNFIEDEQNQEDYTEEQNNNYIDYEEFQIKKRNIYSLFLSDTINIDDINFDLTDNLINNMYDKRKETLLKNTQTNNDYNLRINAKNYDPKYYQNKVIDNNNKDKKDEENKDSENNEDNVIIDENKSEENIKDEVLYLDEEKIKNKDDDFLVLKYNKNNTEDLPLLEDIINNEYNEIYKPPIYDIPEIEKEKTKKKEKKEKKEKKLKKVDKLKEFQDNIINNNYPLFEKLINPYYPTNYIPSSNFPLQDEEKIEDDREENDEEKKDEEDEYNDFDRSNDENKDEDENEYINDEEDESYLKLINNQDINRNEDLVMFDNIIANNFDGNYKIPTYKIPYNLKNEIEKEEQKLRKEKEEYNKNKNQNIVNISENGELKKLNEIIKDEEKPKVEDIINANNNIVYNPPTSIPKSENDEKKTLSQNDRYSGYNDGGFMAASTIKNESEIKNNMVENIINNNNNNKYTIPSYHSLNQEKIEEQKNEDMKEGIKEEDSVNNDNYNKIDYPTVNEMIKKDYNEEDNKEENKKFKESINDVNNNDEDKIVVDDLNDIEDNEENYGF